MVPIPLRVLILEDRPSDAELILNELLRAGFEPDWQRVETEQDYVKSLEPALDIILADHQLPQFDAPRALHLLQARGLDVPFIVVSGVLGDELAVELMKRGAADYVLKDRLGRLGQGVVKALEQKRLREQRRHAEEQVRRHHQRHAVLRDINLAITSTLDLRTVLDILIAKVSILLPYSTVMVWLLNRENGLLERAACCNLSEKEWKGRRSEATPPLVKAVVERRLPTVVDNIQTDPRTADRDFFRRHGLVSYLGVPMVAKGEVLGVLSFLTRDEYTFDGEEVEFLTALAGEAAMAIHNSQLYEEVGRRTRDISALYAVTSKASESLDLDSVLQEVIKKITEIFNLDCTRIFLFDPQTGELHMRASFETQPELFAQANVFPRGQGIVGRVAQSGEPVLFEDALTDPRYRELSQSKTAIKARYRFFAVFPIKSKLRTVGTIVCIGRVARRLTRDETRLISSMADQIGVAVENTGLFEEVKKRSLELEALVKINRDIAALLDRGILLARITEEARKVLRMDSSNFRLVEGQHLVVASSTHPEGISFRPRLGMGESLSGKVVSENRVVAVRNVVDDPALIDEHREMLRQGGYRAFLGVPLRVGKRVIGTINLLSRVEREFSSKDISLITAFADQAAIAIENANLFAEVKNKTVALEKAYRVKSEFLSIMSHELKTPLNVVMCYMDMMQRKAFGEINVDQERALRKSLAATQELHSMINEILEVTMIESGKAQVNPEEIDLVDFLRDLSSSYDPPVGKEITLCWHFDPDLPVIKTDGVKLRQILQSLISNAIKFTNEGRVSLSVRRLPRSQSVEFRVRDTGIGIQKEILSRIFEMFHQADSSNTRAYGGIGLGLYIVSRYAEALGGKIEVESDPGKGSTFSFILPYGGEEDDGRDFIADSMARAT